MRDVSGVGSRGMVGLKLNRCALAAVTLSYTFGDTIQADDEFFDCVVEEAGGAQDLASSCPTLLASVRDSQWPSPFSTARWRWTAVAWNEIQTYDWY